MHIFRTASRGVFPLLVLSALLLTACNRKGNTPAELASIACEASCLKHKDAGEDLSRGPCLSDAAMPEGWVCDVAHNPREAVDEIPANQCAAFRLGHATHIVEVSEDCEAFHIR